MVVFVTSVAWRFVVKKNYYTFSEEVKSELCQVEVSTTEEAKIELAGYLKGKGTIVKTSLDSCVSLEVGYIPAARRIMNLLSMLSLDRKKTTLLKNKFQKKRVQIFIPSSVLNIASSFLNEYPNEIEDDIIYFGTFLRGLFVASGSITDPSRHYHFEIVSYNLELLNKVNELSQKFTGTTFGLKALNFNYRLYLKSGKDIRDILEFMGAVRSAEKYDKIILSNQIKADLNRTLNFLEANAKRTAESNAKQINAINKLMEYKMFDNLPDELKKVALLRLENEELSLSEIGEILGVSKNVVYSMIKKILKIAETL